MAARKRTATKLKSSRAKKPRRAGKSATKVVDVAVKIDPKLKARYDALIAEIADARRDEAGQFDRLFEAAGEIIDSQPALWPLGGYASLAEFCETELKTPLRTVQRNARVAKHASPRDIAKFGSTLLDAAIGWVEAKSGGPTQGALPVAFDRMKIPVKREGRETKVALADATVDEVKVATKALLSKGRAKSGKSRAGDVLAAAMRKHKSLSDVTVRVANGFASFQRVPLATLDLFARALIAAKVTPEE